MAMARHAYFIIFIPVLKKERKFFRYAPRLCTQPNDRRGFKYKHIKKFYYQHQFDNPYKGEVD